jgi:hypothetical protein
MHPVSDLFSPSHGPDTDVRIAVVDTQALMPEPRAFNADAE